MNNVVKILVVAGLITTAAAVIIVKYAGSSADEGRTVNLRADVYVHAPANFSDANSEANVPPSPKALPRLVDLGAGKCIPCKMMAPILEELKTEYVGKLQVDFIDVWKNPDSAGEYGIRIIPTQIFYDARGKELFRHEGFFSKEDILGKWKELGVDIAGPMSTLPVFERFVPAQTDARPKDQVCYMCDGDTNPKTLVTVKTEKGDVRLCGPHCYFIMYSCLTEDKTDFEKKVTVTDFASGTPVPLTEAVFLAGTDKNGRPAIQAYANTETAKQAQQSSGGSIIGLEALKQNELSHRCGFCDRACYPQDAAMVRVEGLSTWGCCSHCAMGVAARTAKDIEVRERDRLTGETILVKTHNGSVASIEPPTAVAWFGQRKTSDGKYVSAGCFHQGFFLNEENLKKWVQHHPYETGRQITIHQVLADKMKLSPQQISNACKIGECSPK